MERGDVVSEGQLGNGLHVVFNSLIKPAGWMEEEDDGYLHKPQCHLSK